MSASESSDAGSVTASTTTVPVAAETGATVESGGVTASTLSTAPAVEQGFATDADTATRTTLTPVDGTISVQGIVDHLTPPTTTLTPGVPETTLHLLDAGGATRTTMRPLAEPGSGVNIEPATVQTTTSTSLPSPTSGVEVDWPVITDLIKEGERIDEALASLEDDHVTVEFPPGEYELGEFRSNADDIELIAPEGDATLRIVGDGDTMLAFSGDGWSVQGFEFDFRGRDPKQIIAQGSGWAIRNCVWRGEMDWSDSHPSQAIAARVDYDDGMTLVHGCYFPDGTTAPTEAGYGTAVRVLSDNIGIVQVTDSWFQGFAEGAVDGHDSVGGVLLEGCYIRNSTDAVRVNAPATVQSCVFVNDDPSPQSASSGRSAMRCAIIGDVPANDRGAEVYIGDCDFAWDRGAATGHAIDALAANSDVRVEACRAHNASTTATVGLGGGSLALNGLTTSGPAPVIRNLGGLILNQELETVPASASNRTPPIPSPPPEGTTPKLSRGRVVEIGRPGGSSGRFTG